MVNKFGEKDRSTIYVQPLESGISKEMLEVLKNYIKVFYLGS
jgi:hypothetical protein